MTMTNFRFHKLLVLFPLWLVVATTEAKMRGEKEGSSFQKNRRLVDSLQRADELRHSLANQRTAFQGSTSPFKDELNIPGLTGRNDARARQFRKMMNGRDNHGATESTDATADAHTDETALDGIVSVPMLDSVLGRGKGGSKGMTMSASSRSKGKGGSSSSSSSSRSKGKGRSKGKSKGAKSSDSVDHPTYTPTTMVGTPTQAPRLTDRPTCAPSSGVFPQDVSGFFQAPSGESSQLQQEIDSALSEIQVPSEFEEQCVER